MARLGIIGLGNIGGPVAANLVEDGHEVTVYDVDAARIATLVARGAKRAAGIAAVATASEITFASLPTPEIVESAVAEWLNGAAGSSLFVDLSTNAPAAARRLGERLAAHECGFVEAPLTGGAPGAQARQLLFMVGGDDDAVARCRPLLEKLGRAVFHVGPLGAGNTAKLVNSLMAFSATLVSLEGLAVANKAGVPVRTMIDVIRSAGTGNIFTDRMVEGINERGRAVSFALRLAAKDAGLLIDLGREMDIPTPLAAQVAQTLVAALGAGLGERDFTDLVMLVERQAGLRLQIEPAAKRV